MCHLHSAADTGQRPAAAAYPGQSRLRQAFPAPGAPASGCNVKHPPPTEPRPSEASRSPPTLPGDPPSLLSAPHYSPSKLLLRTRQKRLPLKAAWKRRRRFPAVTGSYLLPPLELAENPFEALVHVVELRRESRHPSEQQGSPREPPRLPARAPAPGARPELPELRAPPGGRRPLRLPPPQKLEHRVLLRLSRGNTSRLWAFSFANLLRTGVLT